MNGYNLLIVSDLHLSEGRDSRSRSFSKNEDFFFDEEFARFLAHYQVEERWDGAKWHLIINGDFLDILQVITVDGAPSDLVYGSEQHTYGLACGERETIYKLGKIAQGHWQFFEALAGFVAAANILTVIKGNHDVEFHYAGLRSAFIEELREAYRKRVEREPGWGLPDNIKSINADNVRFSDWFYHEKELIWIEHGNRYEGLNSFLYWLAPLLPEIPGWPEKRKDEIDLPFGSLFVRYLFNRIEGIEPFADNIKPSSKFLSWLLRKHPFTAFLFAIGDGRHMLKRIHRSWADVPSTAWALREQQHGARLRELSSQSGIELTKLEKLDRLREKNSLKETSPVTKLLRTLFYPWLFLPMLLLSVIASILAVFLAIGKLLANHVPEFLRKLFPSQAADVLLPIAQYAVLLVSLVGLALFLIWLFTEEERKVPSYLFEKAKEIAHILGVQYVVMGHTHDAELLGMGQGEMPDGKYVNTGTWTKVFSEEEQLIRKEVECIFVQGERMKDEFKLKLMEWDDGAGEPRLLKLFRNE